jgi:tRNA(adenine34) deaminase
VSLISADCNAILSREAIDREMMARCIKLSRIAVHKGEYPFAAVIAIDGKIVVEAINRRFRENDLTRHAEVVALSQAQKTLSRNDLRRCTLYSNIEPCAMCSYCIREAWIGRVVYALASPIMGGMSKWNILHDDSMSGRMPQIFGPVPQIVSGLLACEAELAWQDWNPFAWSMIKRLGLLKVPCTDEGNARVHRGHAHSLWHSLQIWLARQVGAPMLNLPNLDL